MSPLLDFRHYATYRRGFFKKKFQFLRGFLLSNMIFLLFPIEEYVIFESYVYHLFFLAQLN